jgi:hypothetical protein
MRLDSVPFLPALSLIRDTVCYIYNQSMDKIKIKQLTPSPTTPSLFVVFSLLHLSCSSAANAFPPFSFPVVTAKLSHAFHPLSPYSGSRSSPVVSSLGSLPSRVITYGVVTLSSRINKHSHSFLFLCHISTFFFPFLNTHPCFSRLFSHHTCKVIIAHIF